MSHWCFSMRHALTIIVLLTIAPIITAHPMDLPAPDPGPPENPLGECDMMEGEPICNSSYIDMFNGGCDGVVEAFSDIEFDQVVCGRTGVFKGQDAFRDSDWYRIDIDHPMIITWTVEAHFPVDAAIIKGDIPCDLGPPLLGSREARGVGEIRHAIISEPVQPGTYWLFLAPSDANDFATCGASYKAMLTSEEWEDPVEPAEEGFANEIELVSHWDDQPEDHLTADLWADDRGYVYLGNRLGASVDIVDVNDPLNPQYVTTYVVNPPNDDALAVDVKVGDDLMFVALDRGGFDGVQIVDVRDPANPQYLTGIQIVGYNNVHNTFYDNGYLYMVNSFTPTMVVIDLTDYDPDNPPAVITEAKWTVENIGNFFVHDVSIINGRAYCSAWDGGVWVYDVRFPQFEPPFRLNWALGDNTHAAWATEDGRWIVTGEERNNGGPIKLYEVEDNNHGTHITHVFTYAIPISESVSTHNTYIVGRRLYVSWYSAGLMVFDIVPETKSLKLVGQYDTSTAPSTPQGFVGAWGVYPFNGRDKVFVSDKETHLWAFDVHIPASGDYDGNAIVNAPDYAAFLTCQSAPGQAYVETDCDVFDFDTDNDVDFADFAKLQDLFE